MNYIFKLNTVSSDVVKVIISMYSERPKIDDAARYFKKDVDKLELANYIVKLCVNEEHKKKDIIDALEKSSAVAQLLLKQKINLEELCLMLKIVNKNLNSSDWI